MLKELLSNLTVVSILAVVNSFLLVYFIIPKISWIIQNRQLLDHPDERSSHNSSIPTMAGVAFFITLIMTLFFIKTFDTDQVSLNIIAGMTLLFIIGLKDDLVLATPRAKTIMAICAILFMLFSSAMQVHTFHGFLGMTTAPVVLTSIAVILMMLTIINAYNLIDGIDGLASLVAIIIFSIYALIFFATDLHFYFLFCLSLIGVLLAYLNYNFSATQKIFMGDTGSLIIGFCIGICTLKFLSMPATIFNPFAFQPENKLIVIAAILWIPLFDMFRVIAVRLYHKKSPFYPDRNHMHHILIDAGLSHFQATMLLGLSNYLLVILIIWLSSFWNSSKMMAVLTVLFIAGVLLFYILKKKITIKNKKINTLQSKHIMKQYHPHNIITMTVKNTKYLLVLASVLLMTGCMSSKKIVYFQDSDQIKLDETLANFQPQIQLGDLITVQVSASDPLSAEIFNLYETPSMVGNPKLLPYLVDGDGNINFPVLGKLKVTEFTTQQIGDQITQALTTYLVAPIVNVRLTNFKITVMGEVKTPGTFSIPNERITLVEALGLAGDLTIQAKRNTVLLIREKNGKRDFVTVDLTNKALFNSPYYYLVQNDVLYVEPNKTKINSSAVGAGTSVLISSIGILISLITLFSL